MQSNNDEDDDDSAFEEALRKHVDQLDRAEANTKDEKDVKSNEFSLFGPNAMEAPKRRFVPALYLPCIHKSAPDRKACPNCDHRACGDCRNSNGVCQRCQHIHGETGDELADGFVVSDESDEEETNRIHKKRKVKEAPIDGRLRSAAVEKEAGDDTMTLKVLWTDSTKFTITIPSSYTVADLRTRISKRKECETTFVLKVEDGTELQKEGRLLSHYGIQSNSVISVFS
jgi:hypothetical protein